MLTQFLLMAPSTGGSDPTGSMMSTIIMFGSIILIFWFMILRPQQKRQKQHQQLIESLKKGDKVILSGGLHGTIAGLEDKTILVQVADNVKMKFDRGSITSVHREAEEKKEAK